MVHLRHYKYKNEQLNSTGILKVKNCTLELENDCRPINISINLKKEELKKKKTFTKNNSTIFTIG